MQNIDLWEPSKFVYRKGKLRASRDRKQVGIGSRVLADSVARLYDTHLKNFARGRLIDLGCGRVPLYGTYRELVTENICVDWANTMHPHQYIDQECDLTQPLPFPDASFDTIILSDVLEHTPEPARLWGEMARILKPQGNLILNIPFYYCIHERPYDFYRYTEYALERFAANAGLDVVLMESIGGVPEILADIVSKSLLWVPFVGPPIAAVVQGCTGVFISTRFGKKLSRFSGDDFPLGYFMVATRS